MVVRGEGLEVRGGGDGCGSEREDGKGQRRVHTKEGGRERGKQKEERRGDKSQSVRISNKSREAATRTPHNTIAYAFDPPLAAKGFTAGRSCLPNSMFSNQSTKSLSPIPEPV